MSNKISICYQSIKQTLSDQYSILHEMIPGLCNLSDRSRMKTETAREGVMKRFAKKLETHCCVLCIHPIWGKEAHFLPHIKGEGF